MLGKDEIAQLVAEHSEAPHARALQKRLAKEITCMVHSEADYEAALEASQILFGKGTTDSLRKLDEATFLSVFEGVPTFTVAKAELSNPAVVMELLTETAAIFPSKGELRRTITGGGLSINKEKVTQIDATFDESSLLNDKYLLVQKGKKNYFIICAE